MIGIIRTYESFKNFSIYCCVYFKDGEKKVNLRPTNASADHELEVAGSIQTELLHASLKESGYKWDSNISKLVKL